jgi:hypothetical protein
MQPWAQLLGLIGYRTNVVRRNQELLESDAGTTYLMEFGLRKGTNIGAVMLLCGMHFSASTCLQIGGTFRHRAMTFGARLVPAL